MNSLSNRIKLFAIIFFTLISGNIFAKLWANQYCEFILPNGWECALEGSEWVCQHSDQARKKEAIIILAAKIRGPQDSLEEYLAYLKKVKTFTLPGGQLQHSDQKTTIKTTINDHPWIDSLHLASEVPGFYTRYLATVKEDLGIAITFSVAKDHYQDYQKIFDRVVATLRVFRAKIAQQKWQVKDKGSFIEGTTVYDPNAMKVDIGTQKTKSKRVSAIEDGSLLLFVIFAGAIGFFIHKKRKKKNAKKNVNKPKK